jgi:hypothetical protein
MTPNLASLSICAKGRAGGRFLALQRAAIPETSGSWFFVSSISSWDEPALESFAAFAASWLEPSKKGRETLLFAELEIADVAEEVEIGASERRDWRSMGLDFAVLVRVDQEFDRITLVCAATMHDWSKVEDGFDNNSR